MDTANDASFAYQAVYRYLVELIEASPSAGERQLPSLRQLARRLGVSVSSVTKYMARATEQCLLFALDAEG